MNKKEKNKTLNRKRKLLKTTLVDFFETYCLFYCSHQAKTY